MPVTVLFLRAGSGLNYLRGFCGDQLCTVMHSQALNEQRAARTDGDYEESYAAWAPDGRHIVYSSDVGGKHGKHNLYVLAPDGETTIRLTEGDWKDSYAFWTRDGNFIYFNSDRAGATNIYRLLMDGVECVREDD